MAEKVPKKKIQQLGRRYIEPLMVQFFQPMLDHIVGKVCSVYPLAVQ